MELVLLNCLLNILVCLYLVSFINCLPQVNRNQRANVRFPDRRQDSLHTSYPTDEYFGLYDNYESGDDKRVRSPTANGWPMDNFHTTEDSYIRAHLNSRSDDLRPSKAKGGPMPDDGKIFFPGQTEKTQKNKTINFLPNVKNGNPPCANGKPFCENLDYYPGLHLKNVLKKDEMMYQAYFGRDVIPPNDTQIYNRIDDKFEERKLCESQEKVIFPKMAENKDGNWLYVANVENYIQGIRVEECLQSAGTPCSSMASFPDGYTATCEQKYTYRKLIALDSSGKAIPDSFRLPACCTCKVLFHPNLSARSKLDPEPLPLTISSTDSTTTKIASLRARSSKRLSNSTIRN